MGTGLCECGCGNKTGVSKKSNPKTRAVIGGHFRFVKGHHRRKNDGHSKSERDKKYAKSYRDKNKEKIKKDQVRYSLWSLYRITPEDRDKIDAFQKEHPTYSSLLGKRLGTDHCHKTGLIRGRLDWRINRAYGMIEKAFPKNTAEVLRALAVYHEQPPAVIALRAKKYGLIGQAKYKKKMVYGPPKEKKSAR